jgi:hypothetical protein
MSLQTNIPIPGRVHRMRSFDNGNGTYTLIDTHTSTLYEWAGGPYVDVFPSGVDDQFPAQPTGQRPRPSSVISVWDELAEAPRFPRNVLFFRDYVETWLNLQEQAQPQPKPPEDSMFNRGMTPAEQADLERWPGLTP